MPGLNRTVFMKATDSYLIKRKETSCSKSIEDLMLEGNVFVIQVSCSEYPN